LIDLIASTATPEALIEGQHNGSLSGEEAAELDDFVQLEHLVIMAKARARQRLAGGGCR